MPIVFLEINSLITFFLQNPSSSAVGIRTVDIGCSAVDSYPIPVFWHRARPPNMDTHGFGQKKYQKKGQKNRKKGWKSCQEYQWYMFNQKKRTFDTRDSRVVPHRSTDQAQGSLTSQFGWDAVYSPWYDRMMGTMFLWCMPCRKRKNWWIKKKFCSIKKKNCSIKKNFVQWKKICANEKKHSTPEIPAWSPTAVLIGPKGA